MAENGNFVDDRVSRGRKRKRETAGAQQGGRGEDDDRGGFEPHNLPPPTAPRAMRGDGAGRGIGGFGYQYPPARRGRGGFCAGAGRGTAGFRPQNPPAASVARAGQSLVPRDANREELTELGKAIARKEALIASERASMDLLKEQEAALRGADAARVPAVTQPAIPEAATGDRLADLMSKIPADWVIPEGYEGDLAKLKKWVGNRKRGERLKAANELKAAVKGGQQGREMAGADGAVFGRMPDQAHVPANSLEVKEMRESGLDGDGGSEGPGDLTIALLDVLGQSD